MQCGSRKTCLKSTLFEDGSETVLQGPNQKKLVTGEETQT